MAEAALAVRALRRAPIRRRMSERYDRARRRVSIDDLVKSVIEKHGLSEEIRQGCVFLFWRHMVSPTIAAKTSPESIHKGVLRVWTTSSAWVHELQFYKAQMIEQINAAVSRWPGGPPIVTDIRFVLGTQRERSERDALLAQVRMLQGRRRPPAPTSPPVTEAHRQAIHAETACIDDEDLRATIESLRLTWDR
jgi:predicted nucleic acid-binding Zn ribbon protein